MTNQIALQKQTNLSDLMTLGDVLAQSNFFSDASQKAQAVVKVLAGQEMGFGPIASMTGIHVIKGKVSVGANLMAAAVKGHQRYDYRVTEMSEQAVTLEFYQDGKPIGKSRFTVEDARKAGTQNMNKFPRNMLFARAISNGIKWYCPDALNGNTVYLPDELGVETSDNSNVVIHVEPPDPQQSKLEHFNNWFWPAVQKRTNDHFQTPDQLMSALDLTPQTLPDPNDEPAWIELGKKARQHHEAETIPDADGKLADFQSVLDERGVDNGNRQMWIDSYRVNPDKAIADLSALGQSQATLELPAETEQTQESYYENS